MKFARGCIRDEVVWRLVLLSLFLCILPTSVQARPHLPLPVSDPAQFLPRPPAFRPAAAHPLLTWPAVENAVFYEVEFLSEPPEVPCGMNASSYRIGHSDHLFSPGYVADLEDFPHSRLFWRVQAYDLDGNPLAPYTEAREIRVSRQPPAPFHPASTTGYATADAPLYPVYSWTPVAGAWQYELEFLKSAPDTLSRTEPSRQRLGVKIARGCSYYSSSPRTSLGDYYWRVRALDGIGDPLGDFSDAEKITGLPKNGRPVATFGDSLTHGGGALSHSPAEPEYSYQSYLDFATVNLGRSGDTTADLVQRFSQDVLPFNPRLVLILGGTNDLRGGASPQSVIHNLSALRDLCLSRGIRPVFLTLPPLNPVNIRRTIQAETAPDWKQNFQTVNQFIRQQRYYIDIAPALSDGQGELPSGFSTDGLHPDITGKKRMAAIINIEWDRVSR